LILARFAQFRLTIEIDSSAQFAALDYLPDQHRRPLGLKIGALPRLGVFKCCPHRLELQGARGYNPTEPGKSMVNPPHLLAAVDLGSNSFRLIVGRVEETPLR
jgi:hypothetical protein